jgi:D-galactarolactone cycloisomerase
MTYPPQDHHLSAATIDRVEAHVLRCPIDTPVRTSFGVMHDRPAVFIRVIDRDGASGWGEVWCNFPSCGAEHRAALVQTVFAPLVEGQRVTHPAVLFDQLSARTAVLALQSGEHGPIAQVIAGIDLAVWDLQARRARDVRTR